MRPCCPPVLQLIHLATELGRSLFPLLLNYFLLRLKSWLTAILTQRRQQSSVKSKLLIPALLPSGQILKTCGGILHANACLDPCRAIDAWPPPPLWSSEVTHNPCSCFIIEMWMRKVRGRLSSIGQRRNIWLSHRGGSAKSRLFRATKVAILNAQTGLTPVHLRIGHLEKLQGQHLLLLMVMERCLWTIRMVSVRQRGLLLEAPNFFFVTWAN